MHLSHLQPATETIHFAIRGDDRRFKARPARFQNLNLGLHSGPFALQLAPARFAYLLRAYSAEAGSGAFDVIRLQAIVNPVQLWLQVGQLALNTTVDSLGKTIDIGTKVKLISGIAQSVIKALSKNETVEVKNEAADLTFAAGIAGDIAFTLFRAKTQGLITAGDFDLIKAKLLLDIPKLGGAGYGPFKVGTVLQPGAILTAMNDAFAGTSPLNKYEDGTRPGDTTVNPDIPAYPKAYPSAP